MFEHFLTSRSLGAGRSRAKGRGGIRPNPKSGSDRTGPAGFEPEPAPKPAGEYLFTALDPEGRRVTDRLEAESADAVVLILETRGYSEIVLHTDDVGALYSKQGEVASTISPKEFVGLRQHGSSLDILLFAVRKHYQNNWKWYLPSTLWLAGRWFWGPSWGVIDYLALTFTVFPLAFIPFFHFFLPTHPGDYNRLIEAIAWGRWAEALERLPAVRAGLPAEEAAFREGQALAGLGRLDEALRVVRPFSDGQRIPEWMYWSRLPDLYSAAGQPDRIIVSLERAESLAPKNATVLLDLALAVLRYRRDADRGRVLIDRAKSHAISDVLAVFVELAEGMWSLEVGNATEAKRRLEQSRQGQERFRNASPLIGAALARTDAYLALAESALGDRNAAKRHFRQAEPRLRALKSLDLIERCERALSGRKPSDGAWA